ncbi:MAG TPA: FimV/HubP family polar landmark protein [Methylophilus sp.]
MTVHAAGLGNMMSGSKLGEPLKAEIELLAVSPGELSGIQASLASEQFYQDQQLEKPASYPFIKVEVGNNSKGQPVLKLSSSQPITEAFLDMLIQVDWPTGRLVKEYTLLLDPPGFESNYVSEPVTLPGSPETAAATAAPTKTTPSPVTSDTFSSEQLDAHEHPDALKPEPGKQKASRAKQDKPKAEVVQSEAGVEVQRGDTLNQIARQFKPEDASVEQMLAALYQSNPAAFDGKNMNRLKVGKILKLPDHSILAGITQQQAQQLVSAQTADWEAYKNALAKAVEHAPVADQSGSKQQAAGKIGANHAAAPASEAGKDVLKLSAGDEKSSVQTDKSAAKGMQDKLNALQEDLTAKDNALKEEQSRTVDLEKQVADMKKLLAMKNDAMAKLQQESVTGQAAQTEAQPQAAAPTPPPAPAPAAAEPAPVADTTPPAVDDQAAQPTVLQALLDRYRHAPLAMLIALFALPLLAAIWVWMRVRRKKQIHSFEDAIVTSPATEMQGNTVFGQTQAASGDTSFLTDFSQSAVGGMIDANDVDPIAEAEVYMAYGRDAQAEEILKDAIEKDPQRQELKLKLLEIYQAAANVPAFNQVAQTLYAVNGAATPGWPKVVAMGSRLDPANPLYQSDSPVLAEEITPEIPPAREVTEDALSVEADADMNSAEASMAATESVNPALKPKPLDLPALDFEAAGAPGPESAASPFSGEPTLSPADNAFDAIPELSFELGGSAEEPASGAQATLEASNTSAVDKLDDDLSLAEEQFPEIALDIPADLPEDLVIEAGAEEVDTKLDLIKAYIDMEDIIGAKELIDEVLKEGSETQRSRAQALLAQLPQ